MSSNFLRQLINLFHLSDGSKKLPKWPFDHVNVQDLLKYNRSTGKKLNTTRTIFCTIIVCASLLTSCSSISEPQCMNEEKLRLSVFSATIGEYCWSNQTKQERLQNTKVLEWKNNANVQGESYSGYFVIYRVVNETIYYVLVDLVEFDDGRYEWRIIDFSKSLSEVQSNLY